MLFFGFLIEKKNKKGRRELGTLTWNRNYFCFLKVFLIIMTFMIFFQPHIQEIVKQVTKEWMGSVPEWEVIYT